MSATSCNPTAVAPPCIPFLFPDNGCWGRAHEMRRLMTNMGIYPRKVWIHGSLHTLTRNNPNLLCELGLACGAYGLRPPKAALVASLLVVGRADGDRSFAVHHACDP
jgi:hypothetical protein